MEDTENIPQKSNKRKKILKWILKVVLSILLWVSVFVLGVALISNLWTVAIISSCVTILFIILENFVIKMPQTSKLKKRIKWVLIVVYCVIVIVFLWFIIKPYWMEKNCKCMCGSSSGREVCDCPEYICYEKGMRNRLQKCKNRCKIKIRKSHNSCISECEQEFQKNWIWIN